MVDDTTSFDAIAEYGTTQVNLNWKTQKLTHDFPRLHQDATFIGKRLFYNIRHGW